MPYLDYERLTPGQLYVVKDLFRRGGPGCPVTMPFSRRRPIPGLWRRGIVQVWHRQVPDDAPGVRGPFYSLSLDGRRLAAAIFHPLNRSEAA
jgi:hypothetical protein